MQCARCPSAAIPEYDLCQPCDDDEAFAGRDGTTCRYYDCSNADPLMLTPGRRITCETCRKEMGLASIAEDSRPYVVSDSKYFDTM